MMVKHMRVLAAMAVAFSVVFSPVARASEADAQEVVDKARITIMDLHKDQEFGNAKQLLRGAKAVLIVPALFKGGFFFGGEGGSGVLLTQHHGVWSSPAFYTLASASFGLQIGAETAELILIVRTERGLQQFMKNKFKIGAQAGLAVATLGSTAEASTTPALGADIIVWSSATGLYGGITVNGSIIQPRESYNQDYYGQPVSSYGIVDRDSVSNPGADRLRQDLADISAR
jgi:lipid-binding SYLF domain-containing protein